MSGKYTREKIIETFAGIYYEFKNNNEELPKKINSEFEIKIKNETLIRLIKNEKSKKQLISIIQNKLKEQNRFI